MEDCGQWSVVKMRLLFGQGFLEHVRARPKPGTLPRKLHRETDQDR